MAPEKNIAVRRLMRAVEELRNLDNEIPSQVIAVFLAIADNDGISMKDLSQQLNPAHQVAWYQVQGMVDKTVSAKAILDLSFVKGHLEVPKD